MRFKAPRKTRDWTNGRFSSLQVQRIGAKRSKLTTVYQKFYCIFLLGTLSGSIVWHNSSVILHRIEGPTPLTNNLQKKLLIYSTFSSGPFWASISQTKFKPAIGAPMKAESPWHMVTKPNAFVSLSSPINSTMRIDRNDTNAAAKSTNKRYRSYHQYTKD